MARSPVAGALTLGALLAAVAVTAIVLFGGGGDYSVEARFTNAGQLVAGNAVQSGGVTIGSVEDIDLAENGDAIVSFSVDEDHSPLPAGTRAAIRQSSLSGIANRYVDLTFPPHRGRAEPVPDGGRIGADRTRTQVDLDQIFNTLDPSTRRSLQRTLQGGATALKGQGRAVGRGFEYLNPALATGRRLFEEATRDTGTVERLLTDSSRLVTALSRRHDELAALISDASTTTRALGSQKSALAESIELLPPVMRRANTTFVNLRAALGDVDPLVDSTEPLVPLLDPLLTEARALAAGAEPAVRDLRVALRRPGRDNDVTELVAAVPPLARIAVDSEQRSVAPGGRRVSVGEVPGAFPQASEALQSATPVIGFARPHTGDFLGWLDDFSTTGGFFDALGGTTRVYVSFAENLTGGPPKRDQYHRCPGGADIVAPDRSNLLSAEEQERLGCREEDRAIR